LLILLKCKLKHYGINSNIYAYNSLNLQTFTTAQKSYQHNS
jgi:hypothetical protein